MKLLFIFLCSLFVSEIYGQTYSSGGNNAFNSWSVYQTNSPTNNYLNRYNCVNINRDSIVLRTKYIMMDSISNYNYPMVAGAKFAWLDGRQMKISYLDSFPLSVQQITAALGSYPVLSVNTLTGNVILSTSNISEGSNLYYTAARTRTTITVSTGLSYDNSTGVITNTAPNIPVVLTASANIVVSGSYPSFTLSTPTQTSPLTSAQVTAALGAVPLFVEVDGSITNEIQTISGSNTQTMVLSLSGGTFVIPTQTVSTSLIGAGITTITGSYPNFTVNTAAYTASTGITINTTTITNSLPDRTVSITAANPSIAVSGTYPNFTLTPYAPSTSTVSRAINSATFQPSTTKIAWVYYTIRINCVATIGSASAGTVALQYSIDSGSTWNDVGQIENSNTVTLAIVLNSSTTQTGQLSGIIPAGAIVRMNQTITGTTTITYVRGQETF